MPKARKRKKNGGRVPSAKLAGQERTLETNGSAGVAERPQIWASAGKSQNVLFSVMIALGFWGFAIFCFFFYTEDANHNIYGALMALTAVGWSVAAVRRWTMRRPRA